jgi:gas vesicle protein
LNCIAYANQSKYYFYKLKAGETASFVLHRARLLPLYKKSGGSVDEAALTNQKNIRDIDKLGLGEKIYFTKAQVDEAFKKSLILVSPDMEISFTDLAFEIQRQKLSKKNFVQPEKVAVEQIKEEVKAFVKEVKENLKEEVKQLVKLNLKEAIKEQAKETPKEVIREVAAELPVQKTVELEKIEAVAVEEKPKDQIILKESDSAFSELAIAVGSGYSALNGYDATNNTRAQMLSKINSQIQLNWIQNWDETVKTAFYVGYKSSHFEPDYRSIQIYNTKMDTYKFGFEFEDQLVQRFKYVLGFQQSEELFYRGIVASGATGLEINAVPLSSFHFGLKKSLLKRGRYELGTSLTYKYMLGSDYQNYTIQNGNAYAVQLFLQETLYNKTMNCGVTYRERKQNTSLLTFSEKNVDLSCFYKWAY